MNGESAINLSPAQQAQESNGKWNRNSDDSFLKDLPAKKAQTLNIPTLALEHIKGLIKEHPDQLCDELLKLGEVPPPEFFEFLSKDMVAYKVVNECLDSFASSIAAGNALSIDMSEALVYQLGKANICSDEVLKRVTALGTKNGADTVLACYAAGVATVVGKEVREVMDRMKLPLTLKSSILGRLVRNSESMSGLSPQVKIEILRGLDVQEVSITTPFVIESWLKTDQKGAVAYLRAMSVEDSNRLLNNSWFLQKLIDIDPKTSATILASLPATEANSDLFRDGVRLLALRDSMEVKNLLDGFPNGGTWDGLRIHAIASMTATADENAIRSITTTFGADHDYVSRGIARGLAQRDISKAVEYISSLPDGGNQVVKREVATTAALSSPETAVKLLENPVFSREIGSDFRNQMIDHTVRSWAKQNIEVARSWVEALPEKDLPQGVQGLMHTWMRNDPVAASKWLANLAPGPARDAGARQIIQQVKNTDPEMAELWQKSLSQQATEHN